MAHTALLLLVLLGLGACEAVGEAGSDPTPGPPGLLVGGTGRVVVELELDPPIAAPGSPFTASLSIPKGGLLPSGVPMLVELMLDGERALVEVAEAEDRWTGAAPLLAPNSAGDYTVAVSGGWEGGEWRGGAVLSVQDGELCPPGQIREVGLCHPTLSGHPLQLDGLAIVNNGRQGRTMIHPRRLAFWGEDVIGCFSDSVGVVRREAMADPFAPPDSGPDPLSVSVAETLLSERDLDFCQDLSFDPQRGTAVVAGRGTSGRPGFLASLRAAPGAGPADGAPAFYESYSDPAGWEGVILRDDLVFATRKPDKLDVFELAPDGTFLPLGTALLPGALASWSLALDGTRLYVLDAGAHLSQDDHSHETTGTPHDHPGGTGRLYVVDVAAPDEPTVLGWTPLAGIPKGLALLPDAVVAVANGAEGVELIDASNPEEPQSIAVHDTPGSVMDLAWDGGYLLGADWSSVRLWDASEWGVLRLLDTHEGFSNQEFAPAMPRGGIGSAMDVELLGDRFALGDFNNLWVGRIEPGRRGPRLVVLDRASTVDPGATEEVEVRIHNGGTELLSVEVEGSDLAAPGSIGQTWILPGESDVLRAVVTGPTQGQSTAVRLLSNDTETPIRQAVYTAVQAIRPGDSAPHVMLPYTNRCDADGCDRSISCFDSQAPQDAGRPVLLAYFASW